MEWSYRKTRRALYVYVFLQFSSSSWYCAKYECVWHDTPISFWPCTLRDAGCFFRLLSFFFLKTTTLFFHCLSCFFFFLLSTPVFSIFMLAHLYQRGHLAQAPSSTHESTIFLCAIQRVCSGKINPVRNFNFLSRWMDVNLVPIPTISSHVKMNIDDTHR